MPASRPTSTISPVRPSTSFERPRRGAPRHVGLHRREAGRPLGELPDRVAVATISGLQLGVLAAADDDYDRIASGHPRLRVVKV
jgi:hypothetical protein